MAKKLSAEDRLRLERALSSWESWRDGPRQLPELISQLDGESNHSFVVSEGARSWVLRLNNPKQDSGINRDNERLALEAAYEAGISPLPSFYGDEALVTPLLSGPQATLENLSAVGDLFFRVHSLTVDLLPLDLLQHLKNYYERTTPEPLLNDCYQQIVDLYPKESIELKPCHNDCLLPNMINSEKGLFLIDWEYAAATDPAYDLAVFSSTYNLDRERKNVLLSAYALDGNFQTEGLLARIEYFEKYYRLIEMLWWDVRGQRMEGRLESLAQDLAN